MLDQDDGGVGHLVDPPQQRDEGLGLPLGDARRGLVEEQQARLGQDDGGQVDDPPRPGGQLGRAVVAEPLEPEGGDDLVDRLELAPLGPAGPGQAERGREHRHLVARVLAQEQDVEHGELGEQAAVLEGADHADAQALLGQVLGQVDVVEAHACPTAASPAPRSRRASSSCPSRWRRSARRWIPARPSNVTPLSACTPPNRTLHVLDAEAGRVPTRTGAAATAVIAPLPSATQRGRLHRAAPAWPRDVSRVLGGRGCPPSPGRRSGAAARPGRRAGRG